MKRKLKMAVSTLAVASLLVSTVFSNVYAAEDADLSEITDNVETPEDELTSEAGISLNTEAVSDVQPAAEEETPVDDENKVQLLAEGEAVSFTVWFDDIAVDGAIPQGTLEGDQYGGSLLTLVGNKNSDGSLTDFTVLSNAANLIRDGKTVNGYKAGNRHATANDIPSVPQLGDGTALVFSPVADGTATAYIWSSSFLRVWDFDSTTGERYGYTDSDTAAESYSFAAKAGHTYVLSTTGKTNNMAYAGFEYVVDEPLNVTVDPWIAPSDSKYDFSNVTFALVDANLGDKVAEIGQSTTSVTLNKDHRYVIESSDPGAAAYFDENNTEVLKVEDNTKIQLHLVEIPNVELEGVFLTNDGGASDVTEVTFTNTKNGTVVNATVADDKMSYTAVLKPGDYTTAIKSDNYITADRVKVVEGEVNNNLIYLETIDTNNYTLPDEVGRTSRLTFSEGISVNNSTSIKVPKDGTIVVPVSGVKEVTVAGWYEGTWNINGKGSVTADHSSNAASPVTTTYVTDGTETSVTVNATGDGTNYLYWIRVSDVGEYKWNANKTTFNVPGDFATLKEANAFINAIEDRPEGEDGRVTIKLTEDLEEQVVFDAPYVTLDGDGHTLSWYYGVGSFYYSIDEKTGLYSDRLFYDRYSSVEGNGSLWGGVAIVRGDNFKALNTTFKNTYNYEVTEKDSADFDHATGTLVTDRQVGTNVATYNAKERSNAFYIEASNIEIENCKILSSQDTFGRNGSADGGYSVYVKNSVIGGNVDYICGNFTAVFDNCELQWKTYSDKNNEQIGYIVAPKENPYVFRNCVITSDNESVKPVGKYGRTWGANSTAYFTTTETNGMIDQAAAWGEMSSGDSKTAHFYEYNNTSGGEPFASTGPDYASQVSDKSVADVLTTDKLIDVYVGGSMNSSDVNLGDATGDSIITATDASVTYFKSLNDDYVLPIQRNYPLMSAAEAKSYVDVNENGSVGADDASQILSKAREADYEYSKSNQS